MVPLRIESYLEAPPTAPNDRPRLVLQDTSAEYISRQKQSRQSRRRTGNRWENLLFTVAVIAILAFFVANLTSSLWRSAQSAYTSSLSASAPVITVKVASGDTLWHYAALYGSPDRYILDRVETIARDNHLSSDTPLVPGQYLQIAVTNPIEVARLQHAQQPRIAFNIR